MNDETLDTLIDKGYIDDMLGPEDIEQPFLKGEQHDQDSNETSDDFESEFFEEYA